MSPASDVLLSDGSTVHIRQIGPDDADRIVALHSRFSERTRYLRYFSPYPRIPARDLARFVNVDHRDREALVMATGDDLIAVGRYERLGPAAPDAEVAFVVEDAYQGRGVGSLLLEHLAEAARAVGSRTVRSGCCRGSRPFSGVQTPDTGSARVGRVWCTFPSQPRQNR